MNGTTSTPIEPIRFEKHDAMLLAGISEVCAFDGGGAAAIPAQWDRFGPHIGKLEGQVGAAAYGVCSAAAPGSAGFTYTCAVEVRSGDAIPKPLSVLEIPAHRYAAFQHRGHISTIRATCEAIFRSWFPGSGCALSDDGLSMIEVYGEAFDPGTGLGGVEIWVPVSG